MRIPTILLTLAFILTSGIAAAREPSLPAPSPESKGFVLRSADGRSSLRLLGLLQLQLAYDRTADSPRRRPVRQPGPRWSDQRLSAVGHYTQLGYVIARRFEPVTRYSFLRPGGEGTAQHDLAGGLNVFIRGHHFKWQTFVSARFQPSDGKTTPDMRVQSQLSLAF